MKTKLLTKSERKKLLANGRSPDRDHKPVVKLFTPDGNATWLLTEIDPRNEEIAFGLADLGLDTPELGYVSLKELAQVRGKLGLPVERDRYFRATMPISRHAELARQAGRIVEQAPRLEELNTLKQLTRQGPSKKLLKQLR